jgi:hypothetical protein
MIYKERKNSCHLVMAIILSVYIVYGVLCLNFLIESLSSLALALALGVLYTCVLSEVTKNIEGCRECDTLILASILVLMQHILTEFTLIDWLRLRAPYLK